MTVYDIGLEEQIAGRHDLYKIEQVVVFSSLVYRLKELEKGVGRAGYGAEVGLRCLYLQFHYDLSDRELEERLRFDIAFRWFCGFSAYEETPDHTYFCRFRKSVGTKRVGKIFNSIVTRAKKATIIRPIFRFVDASAIVSKNTTWAERDKAIQEGEDGVNNDNIKQYGSDNQARFGCKGTQKFWYGYKRHANVDMSSMLIESIAATPANVSDQGGFRHICPRGGQIVFGDKSYCLAPAQHEMKKRGANSAAILRHNMLKKNKDLDRWISSVRAPFEGVFSKCQRRARYRGLAKVQMQCFMEAIAHNLKRLVSINAPPLPIGA